MYTAGPVVRQRFVRDLEAEGFAFGDGAKPSARPFDDMMAVHPDMTVSCVGFAGMLGFGGRNKP